MDDGAEPAVEIACATRARAIPRAYRQLIFEKYGRVDGPRRAARRAAATGWAWCSAGAPSAFTAARSGWRTAPAAAAASACGCPSRGCRCPRRAGPPAGRTARWRCRSGAKPAKRVTAGATRRPGTRRLLAEYRQEVWEFTDRLFLWLLLGQWWSRIATALLTTPQPWRGRCSGSPGWPGRRLVLGVVITALPLYRGVFAARARAPPGARSRSGRA